MFALLTQAKMLVEQQAAGAATSHETPSRPSGMQPPTTSQRRPPAARKGPGASRATPASRCEAELGLEYVQPDVFCHQVEIGIVVHDLEPVLSTKCADQYVNSLSHSHAL